ncbi:MAG: hypothetical protein IPK81_22245 [Rhodospirillales bacterium]|nr:MAG: hypothetical protein IPK81_22245 [Rhodospirillales bacterium]
MDSASTRICDFQFGMSEDGGRCLMIVTDDQERSMTCAADFAQFTAFVSSLNMAAREMVKRQTHGAGGGRGERRHRRGVGGVPRPPGGRRRHRRAVESRR